MSNTTLLPAIRSYVGDWNFYATTLSFGEVMNLVKEPDEIHERQKLSDWIQRKAIEPHSEAISEYIIQNEQRFLGSLIIGIYDGSPNWAPLRVNFTQDHLNITDDQKSKIEGKLGFLHLSGHEKLFAMDGQHRVAGIKKALQKIGMDTSIKDENVSAIFVAHDASSIEGRQRTRRLFTTVNKTAKPISKAAIIALDEDNGFAVVTRKLIDNYWLFEDEQDYISYTSTGSISAGEENTITSVVGLFEIIQELFPRTGRKNFESKRPTEAELETYFDICTTYLDLLMERVPEYKEVFIDKFKKASDYRRGKYNHMLFRPIGQKIFARSVQLLISRGNDLDQAIETLLAANMYIVSDDWYHILWNPIDKKMITNKVVLAETQLLVLVGEQPRNRQNGIRLQEFLESVER